MIHGALEHSKTPLSAQELIDALPAGKFEIERITILLEVMQSRNAVVATGHGSTRRYAVPEASAAAW